MANTLINNKVLGETIAATLPGLLKFGAVAVMETELIGQAGDTIKVDKFAYVGEATDVAEGTAIPVKDLVQTTKDVVIKKAGTGIQLTDEEVKRKGTMVVTEVERQIGMAVKDKIDSDCYAALSASPLKITLPGKLDFEGIINAKALFLDEDEEPYAVYIHPTQEADVLLAPGFIPATALGDEFRLDGSIGRLGGADIIKSIKVKKVGTAYKNILIKAAALGIKLGNSLLIEDARDKSKQITTYYASEMYVPYIRDDTSVVTITTKESV